MPIASALGVLLNPSMLSSAFLSVGRNYLLRLHKTLLSLSQMHREDLCLPLIKRERERDNYNPFRTSIQELLRLKI